MPIYFDLVIAAGLGVILGSFLNALLFRFNTGKSVLVGRSSCMRCGHTLKALDLIPLLSYLLLRGRCRYCGARISWQYPAVEAIAGLLAVLVYLQTGLTLWFVYWVCVWLVLLFIVVYDLRHFIIPWSASLTLMALAFVHVWSLGFGVWDFAAGVILGLPLLLISAMSGGRWMGWGDGFLELSLGWLLGLSMGLSALLMAFWTGAIIGIILLLLAKNRYTMSSEVPFAPFLIVGCGIAYFLHVDFFPYLTLFF